MASWVVLTGLVVMGVGVGFLPMALTGLEPDQLSRISSARSPLHLPSILVSST